MNSAAEDSNQMHITNISKGPFLGVRHLQAVLLFLNIFVLYLNRVHVSLSLVAMTNSENKNADFPVYDWNETEKSYILSSFYWGYIATQFPGAYCARRFGVKINLFVFTMCTGIISLSMPYCISWGGWRAFCLMRFLQGLSQGGFYPSLFQHLSKWSPPAERSLMSGMAHSGFDCGTVTAMFASGFIATRSLGWPGVFYIYAALCFGWCALWYFFGANDVTTSKLVSERERLYIEDALQHSINFEESRPPVPWRAIFTSKPFYALMIVRSLSEAGIVTVLVEWPSYVHSILKFDLESNSFYSALPSVVSWLFLYIFMFISNYVTKRNCLPLSTNRKCFNSFGLWFAAGSLIVIGQLDETYKTFAVIMMVLLVAMHVSSTMGSVIGIIDMAPNHAETISSITNTVSSFMVLLGPLFVGVVVNNEEDRGQWKIAFTTIAVLFCLGDLVYIIWGEAKKQPWNSVEYLAIKRDMAQNQCPKTTINFKS